MPDGGIGIGEDFDCSTGPAALTQVLQWIAALVFEHSSPPGARNTLLRRAAALGAVLRALRSSASASGSACSVHACAGGSVPPAALRALRCCARHYARALASAVQSAADSSVAAHAAPQALAKRTLDALLTAPHALIGVSCAARGYRLASMATGPES